MANKRKIVTKEYVEIPPTEKLKLLNKHNFQTAGWKSLEESKWCLHCEKQFTGQSVRVYKDETESLMLECGTPDCDGSPVDWADYPWWDKNHPDTIAVDEGIKATLAKEEPKEPKKKKG